MSLDWGSLALEAERSKIIRETEWVRVSRNDLCPVCHKPDGCLIHKEDSKYICIRSESTHPVQKGIGGWFHNLDPHALPDWFDKYSLISKALEREQKYRSKEAERYASRQETHDFYAWVLENYRLTQEDRDYLIAEGVKDLSDYGTFPYVDKYYCHTVPNEFKEGIPGLYKSLNNKRNYINLWTYGLYRAIRGVDGLIIGIEIRLSEHCKQRLIALSDNKKEVKVGKYKPLTSAGKNKGISADPKNYGFIKGEVSGNVLLITEGMKKAQIASEILGIDAVGVRGVGLWGKLVNDFERRFEGYSEVIIAYDSDWKHNPMVAQQRKALIKAFKEKQYLTVKTLEWDFSDATKGIDDALKSNIQIDERLHHNGEIIYTAEQVVPVIRRDMESVFRNPNRQINLFKVTVGGGKTQAAINIINDALVNNNWFKTEDGRDARVLWLTENNYELLYEAENKFIIKPTRMEGRSPEEESQFHCQNYTEIELAGAGNQNIINSVCLKCPFRDGCSYLQRSREIIEKDKFVIGVKASFFNESNRLKEFDIIVIDESMSDSVYKTVEITPADIKAHKAIISIMKESCSVEKMNDLDLTEMVLDSLLDEIDMWQLERESNYREAQPKNITASVHSLGEIEHDYESKAYESADGEVFFLKRFIGDINKSVIYVYQGSVYMDVPQFNMMDQLSNTTVINLDATPMMSKLRWISQDINVFQYRVKEYMRIFQVTNLKGSKTQLMDERYHDTYLRCIKFISTRFEGETTTVLSIKPFIDELRTYSREQNFEIQSGWYGNHTRGFNAFQSTSNLVLAGSFCRNLDFMRMQQQTLEFMGVPVTLEEIIREDTVNEMTQAAGRGRATRRSEEDPLNLFILSDIKLPFMYNVTRIASMEALMGERHRSQQEANEFRADVARQKAMDYLAQIVESGEWIPNLVYSSEAKKAKVSAGVMKKAMQETYLGQLLENCQEPERWEPALRVLADSLVTPSPLDIELMGLKLTNVCASVLIKYSTNELRMLISKEEAVYNHLQHHPPVNINHQKWLSVLKAIKETESSGSLSSLATAAGVTRQIASKYLKEIGKIMSYTKVEEITKPETRNEFYEEKQLKYWAADFAYKLENDTEFDAGQKTVVIESIEFIEPEDSNAEIAEYMRTVARILTPAISQEDDERSAIKEELSLAYKNWLAYIKQESINGEE